mgnify:CR=1 FL=1
MPAMVNSARPKVSNTNQAFWSRSMRLEHSITMHNAKAVHIIYMGLCHPERRCPEHNVAYRTAANGHGNATHVAAKPIEVLGRRMPDAGDGKGKSTQKLDELLGSGYGNVVVHHPTTLMGSPLAKAFMFSTAVFINRPRASRVAHAT